MSDSATGRDSPQFLLRLPEALRDRVKNAARDNKRSMNAEIVARLEETFAGRNAHALSDVAGLEEAFTSIVGKMLKDQAKIASNTAARDIIRVFREARAAGDTIDETLLDYFDERLAEERATLVPQDNKSRRKPDP